MKNIFTFEAEPFEAYEELEEGDLYFKKTINLDYQEVEYEQAPLITADSSVANRIVPAHICNIRRNKDGSLRARSAHEITHVVIHSIAGNYNNAIENWRTGRNCFKPHYVVSRYGEITQIVAERHIPMHANNANNYSIGIEHDGFANDPKYFTETMYKASALLTRDVCIRYNIPMDRTHIIGHDEAPGTSHGDPGGFWDWDYYIALVRWNGQPDKKPIRIIIDYTSYSFWPTTDNWVIRDREPIRHTPYPKHSWGARYYRAQPGGDSSDATVFIAEIPSAGTYEVSAWWPVLTDNNPEVTFSVHAGRSLQKVFTKTVNQKIFQGRVRRTLALPNTPIWYHLGYLTVSTGDTVWVEVPRRSSKSGWIVADAIRLFKA